MTAATRAAAPPALAPFSLRDAPSFIERQFPVGRLSAEAYKERKAGAGQTLTALGSYWKGRKPLILVRAVVLGCLLPATDDAAADLDIFLKLMAMDDAASGGGSTEAQPNSRGHFPPTPSWRRRSAAGVELGATISTRPSGKRGSRRPSRACPMPTRVKIVRRPEECDEAELLAPSGAT